MTRANPIVAMTSGNVVTARLQQAVDQRHLEHIAEQQDGDRDRDHEGGDDADLREADRTAPYRR